MNKKGIETLAGSKVGLKCHCHLVVKLNKGSHDSAVSTLFFCISLQLSQRPIKGLAISPSVMSQRGSYLTDTFTKLMAKSPPCLCAFTNVGKSQTMRQLQQEAKLQWLQAVNTRLSTVFTGACWSLLYINYSYCDNNNNKLKHKMKQIFQNGFQATVTAPNKSSL